MTHPQMPIYTGGASDAHQYDAFGNYSRGLGEGAYAIPIAYEPTPDERLATYVPVGHPEAFAS